MCDFVYICSILCKNVYKRTLNQRAKEGEMANTFRSAELIIQEALAIENEAAQEAGALGFMARAMVQATLPHSKVEGNEFSRTNGKYTLSILTPSAIGLPYGSIPRLLLAWITTEAVKTQSREIELGDSLSGFMRELDMVATGGRWGSVNRLKNQTRKLFASTITASYDSGNRFALVNQPLAEQATFWWDTKNPDQAGLWKSTVTLSERFFREVIDRPIPIDMRAIKALKKSPMALDVYSWMTYRVSYLTKPTTVPWKVLSLQFGSNYSQVRDFRAAFLKEVRKVETVYKDLRFDSTPEGLILQPSLTHVRRVK
jgi:hypothetical protein